jgi:hypothetical protein
MSKINSAYARRAEHYTNTRQKVKPGPARTTGEAVDEKFSLIRERTAAMQRLRRSFLRCDMNKGPETGANASSSEAWGGSRRKKKN